MRFGIHRKRRISTNRFLIFVLIFVALFNIIGAYILPRDTFLVFASDINLNELVELANQDRTARGLEPLRVDTRLVDAARAKGEDMLEKDYWSHYGPNGESPWQFIIQNGYNYVYAGENLAKDFSSAEPIHSAWMASPSHRSNILNQNFKDVGIASVTGEFQGNMTTLVVQMFGSLEESIQSPPSEEEIFTPYTEEGTLQAPIITDPKDGDILDKGIFDIRGNAPDGELIHIYDNNQHVGKTNIENASFSFTNSDPFEDGVHHVFVQAEDSNNQKSAISNTVSMTVDTITPTIDKDSATIVYALLEGGKTTYTLHLEITDDPSIVYGMYRDSKIPFVQVDSYWEATIEEEQDSFGDFVIYVEDAAGHKTESVLSENELDLLSEHIETSLASFSNPSQSTFLSGVFSRIITRSMRGKVNFFITLIMLGILVLERFMLARTGLTKKYSYSFLHLPVFAVILFIALIGSGGEIL